MQTEKINEIIAKKLNDEASFQENQELEKWLDQSEDNRQVYDLIKKDWSFNKPSYKTVNADEIKNKIWKESIGQGKNISSYGFSFYLKIAASIVILAAAIFLLIKDEHTTPAIPIEWVTKANPLGQKSKIYLPDGSEVWLNSNSSLQYPKDFTDSTRTLILEGEAYFEAAHDVNRPFTVIAKNISTTAMGTAFNINAFGKDIQVSLVSGKVKVADLDSTFTNNELVVLSPGQSALYRNDNKKIVLQDFDLVAIIGWKDGEIYFNDASFEEIIKKLELWYGVSIQVDEQVDIRKPYTGRFKNESLKNVMENISFSLNFGFEIKDKSMKIFEKQ